MKWILTAAAAASLPGRSAWGEEAGPTRSAPAATGYGTDPVLTQAYAPGDIWPLTLTPGEHRTVTALCDVILPADDASPAASALGVADFIDEWISAPYPGHDADRAMILGGLRWLDAEAQARFNAGFAALTGAQQSALCDPICDRTKATHRFVAPAQFFSRFRGLAAGGYYTTPEGMKAIGFTGNLPLASFEGPTPETLARLGLA